MDRFVPRCSVHVSIGVLREAGPRRIYVRLDWLSLTISALRRPAPKIEHQHPGPASSLTIKYHHPVSPPSITTYYHHSIPSSSLPQHHHSPTCPPRKPFKPTPSPPEEVLPAAENGGNWMEPGLAADNQDTQAFLDRQARGGGEAQVSLSLCLTSYQGIC